MNSELDDLINLINAAWDLELFPSSYDLARRILDWMDRRVVVDDAMIERAAEAMYESRRYALRWAECGSANQHVFREWSRAALTAALDTDTEARHGNTN